MWFIAFFSLCTHTHSTPVSIGYVSIINAFFLLHLLVVAFNFQNFPISQLSGGCLIRSFCLHRSEISQEYFWNACVFVYSTKDVFKNHMISHMKQRRSHMGTINNHMQWIVAFITERSFFFHLLFFSNLFSGEPEIFPLHSKANIAMGNPRS